MNLQLDAVLSANDEYHRRRLQTAPRTPEPVRRLVILTCMDARLDLFRALGLQVGDAHILRNAGGRVTDDVLRSLVVSTHLLNTREIGVVHHSNCGLEGVSDQDIALATGVDDIDFLGFADLEQSVRDDVEALRKCSHLAGLIGWGAIYDVGSGRINVVVDPRQQ